MTDFLTRLAQRAMGTAVLVQPRLASRYAPGADADAPAPLAGTGPTVEPADEPGSVNALGIVRSAGVEAGAGVESASPATATALPGAPVLPDGDTGGRRPPAGRVPSNLPAFEASPEGVDPGTPDDLQGHSEVESRLTAVPLGGRPVAPPRRPASHRRAPAPAAAAGRLALDDAARDASSAPGVPGRGATEDQTTEDQTTEDQTTQTGDRRTVTPRRPAATVLPAPASGRPPHRSTPSPAPAPRASALSRTPSRQTPGIPAVPGAVPTVPGAVLPGADAPAPAPLPSAGGVVVGDDVVEDRVAPRSAGPANGASARAAPMALTSVRAAAAQATPPVAPPARLDGRTDRPSAALAAPATAATPAALAPPVDAGVEPMAATTRAAEMADGGREPAIGAGDPYLFRSGEGRQEPAVHAVVPAVRVTIGRIEVRAPAPLQAPALPAVEPAETPPLVLSLEAYLARRDGVRS